MDIIGNTTLVLNVYNAEVKTTEWSPIDESLLARYDEPQINLGGAFSEGDISFTIAPDKYAKVQTDSPFLMQFPTIDDAQAGDKANIWLRGIISRVRTAMTNLRATDSTNYKGTTIMEVI